MRVALLNGSTTYYLAGQSGVSERAHSSANNIRFTPTRIAQEVNRIRAANATGYDRKNLRMVIEFDTARTFDDPGEAEAFALEYDASYPRTGTLIITDSDNATAYERHIADCMVDPPSRSVMGCTVYLSYRVTGGAVTTPEPEPEP
jgi:hypothetical protein